MFGFPDTHEIRRRGLGRLAWSLVAVGTGAVLWLLLITVDRSVLARAWGAMLGDPIGASIALSAFSTAFWLRAVVWRRVLPQLDLRHAWAAIHLALAGNHLLPVRLGEPLRVVSVVRRTPVGWRPAAVSTLALRAADTVAVALVGVVAGVMVVRRGTWGAVLVAMGALVMMMGALVWLRRLSAREQVRLPGPLALGLTTGAWALEAMVIWQAARWGGIELGYGPALAVSAAAVVAQVLAFAPGGLGTYEAGGTAVLVALGVSPAAGLAVVLTAHALKTFYSLVAGGIAAVWPSPGFFGKLRLQPAQERRSPTATDGRRPVVLFLPAHDEEEAVCDVVRRVPVEVRGHPIRCLVIDDGSTDATAVRAAEAGAEVIRLDTNRGLGAAVREGLRRALQEEPAAVAFCDADGEYSPEELERMVAPILEGRADYVVGSRFSGDIRRMLAHRRVGNRLLTLALSWVARRPISDAQSGYRAFSPQAAAEAEVIHDFNYAQVLTLDLLAKGFRYAEVPISYHFRTTGRSFVRLGPYLRRVVPAVYRELNTA